MTSLFLASLSVKAGSGMETRKWVINVGSATRGMLWARAQEKKRDDGSGVFQRHPKVVQRKNART
jgi:hypothetical protein